MPAPPTIAPAPAATGVGAAVGGGGGVVSQQAVPPARHEGVGLWQRGLDPTEHRVKVSTAQSRVVCEGV